MTDTTTPQTAPDDAQRPADAPTGRPWLEMTPQEFGGAQPAVQPDAAPAGDECGTLDLFTPADTEPAVVRVATVVLAAAHPAAGHNEYGACVTAGFRVGVGSDAQARVHHQLPSIDFTDPERQSSFERWAEQRAQVAKYAETLEADGFTVERREVLTGPILLATPPEAYPSRIGVYCDECGVTVSHDYLVHDAMTKAQRLQVARDHLVANEGWSCTPDADLCPTCAPAAVPCQSCTAGACTLCDVTKPDEAALRNHVLNVHPDEFCGIYHGQACSVGAGR
ncbi:hypothetical protein ACFVJK_46820 [Streptomyces sp. NPDC127172]|uniref:hypothetical protein n=1 Tax=Streptomyces sp. NPDC127172 TaxID=3345382 RepID=UPI0036353A5B